MKSKLLVALAATTLVSALADAQPTSIDLSQYVRVGRYALPEPSNTTPPNASSFLAQEASAVTYNKDTDTLFITGDGSRSIVQVSKTGQYIDSMNLALQAGNPQGTAFYDAEGLAYIGNGQFVLTEERNRVANLFTYAAGTTLAYSGAQQMKLGTTIGNVGLEGVTYDPATGGFIFVKESGPQGIFQTTINFAAGTASNGSPTTVNSINLFDPALMGLLDTADVFALSNIPTLLPAQLDSLLVISQESGKIVQMSRTGTIMSSLTLLPTAGDLLSIPDIQNEGITMDLNGILYVVNENGGGSINNPELWVYAPIPEPSTYAALIGALTFGVILLVRRRKPSPGAV